MKKFKIIIESLSALMALLLGISVSRLFFQKDENWFKF